MSLLSRLWRGRAGESGAADPGIEPAWLIVGLGNPGGKYERTPHNLGFLVVDRLAERHGIRVQRPEAQALVGLGSLTAEPVALAKPQTYMNRSGGSVKALLERYPVTPANLLLIYDELALPWKNIRIRPGGSAGGHRGVASVISSLGTNAFPRLRLGIQPPHPVGDGAKFVLAPFRRAQFEELDELLDDASQAAESILTEGVEKAMARFNRRARGTTEEEE